MSDTPATTPGRQVLEHLLDDERASAIAVSTLVDARSPETINDTEIATLFREGDVFIPDLDTPEAWLAWAHRLQNAASAYMWVLGKWWAEGEHHYGDLRRLLKSPNWRGPNKYQTCANAAYVYRRFKGQIDFALPFYHYAAFASLPAEPRRQVLREAVKFIEHHNRAPTRKFVKHLADQYRGTSLKRHHGPPVPDDEQSAPPPEDMWQAAQSYPDQGLPSEPVVSGTDQSSGPPADQGGVSVPLEADDDARTTLSRALGIVVALERIDEQLQLEPSTLSQLQQTDGLRTRLDKLKCLHLMTDE